MDGYGDSLGGEMPPRGLAGSAPAGGQARLGGRGGAAAEGRRARRDGVRRVRRMSNLTAAALIAGTGAATVALAHHAFPVAAPAAGGSSVAGAGAAVASGAGGPQVSHPVATTSGSGVAAAAQAQTVSGQAVVTQVPGAAYPGS